jgi:hypothetical protein
MAIFENTTDTVDISLFTIQVLIICLLAIPIAIVDIKFENYRTNNVLNRKQRISIVIIQLLTSALYIFALFKMIPNVTNKFQITLPGMYFPGIFFSLQYNLFIEIQEIIKPLALKVKVLNM